MSAERGKYYLSRRQRPQTRRELNHLRNICGISSERQLSRDLTTFYYPNSSSGPMLTAYLQRSRGCLQVGLFALCYVLSATGNEAPFANGEEKPRRKMELEETPHMGWSRPKRFILSFICNDCRWVLGRGLTKLQPTFSFWRLPLEDHYRLKQTILSFSPTMMCTSSSMDNEDMKFLVSNVENEESRSRSGALSYAIWRC